MQMLIQIVAVIAILANAVIYGTDVFGAVVQRPAMAAVDSGTLTNTMGQIHRFGDRRLPVPGVGGLVTAIAVVVLAALDGESRAATAAAIGAVALILWLVIFGRISQPVNKKLTAAALDGSTPSDARALQARWDSVINLRVLLQAVALIALCLALAIASA